MKGKRLRKKYAKKKSSNQIQLFIKECGKIATKFF